MDHESASPFPKVVPNERIPKVLGILNILFASGLMLCGLCIDGYTLMMPTFASFAQTVQQEAQAKAEARKKAEIEQLAKDEEAAKIDEEKADLKARRLALEAAPQPVIPVMDMGKMGFSDPRWIGYIWTDLVTGLVANLLLLASGIGLVQLKEWGRRLGVWTAALKIARLVALSSFMILVLAPFLSKQMGEAASQMVAQQQQAMGRPAGAAPPTRELMRIYGIAYTGASAAMVVIGSIYPAVSIWLLTRPGARAACTPEPLAGGPDAP